MSYLVLARKYRPRIFDEVIDQDHVTRTLANAISSDRVAHAILFSGPRGTGKTTVARILAKAMNCENGPTAVPCNNCRSCREITSGNAVDVFEIDGASNNSVDQVRELRGNVRYMPAHSLYKIYIIDEVHMLSIPAFNALLKTLEEPPDHVLFLFATTEPHKIPVTILSRCQRHDFKRIGLEPIVEHMQSLIAKEGFSISRESLAIIAREAGGSMRDALSLLDQIMACSEETVSDDQVQGLLGVVDRKVFYDISAALFNGDAAELLEILDGIYDRGHDMKRLYAELVEHFRNLMVAKMGANISHLMDLPGHEIEHMREQVSAISAAYLNQMFDLLFKEEATIKFSAQPKIALEMIFFRMLQVKPVLPIDELIDKLDHLRTEISQGTGDSVDTDRIKGPERPLRNEARSYQSDSLQQATGTHSRDASRGHGFSATPPVTDKDSDIDIEEAWEKIQQIISDKNPSLAATLTRCKLKQPAPDRLEIEVTGNGFNLNLIRRDRNLDIIKKVCRDVFARELEIVITAGKATGNDNRKKKIEANRLKTEALSHSLVADAIEIFDGKVVDVKIIKEDDS